MRLAQLAEHARVVGSGVLAEDEDRIGLFKIDQFDRALGHADLRAHGAAARLVAHVGAVGEIVGAELTHKQLVEKRGLVAGATRGVEDRLIGIGQRVQVPGDQRKGVVPADGPVMIARRIEHHGVRESALVFQPEIALLGQLAHRVLGKQLRPGTARGGFCGHGLDTVFAELKSGGVIAVRPRAAGTVEAVGLIGRQQSFRALQGNVLRQKRILHAVERAPATGRALVELDLFFVHDYCLLRYLTLALESPEPLLRRLAGADSISEVIQVLQVFLLIEIVGNLDEKSLDC